MTRKINLNFMFVILVSVFLSVFFTAAVSYRLLRQEVFSNLSATARMIENLHLTEQMKNGGFVEPENELRITWIAADGAVLYDSYAGDALMENHGDRPEVIQAMESGEGMSSRESRTMERSIFFYARKTGDGSVIRIAKEAGSIFHIYRNILPAILLVAAGSFLVSMWFAKCLTRAFVRPIAQMADDMEHLENITAYKELDPFLELIRARQAEALKNVRIRKEFTANVSHELKTPLTSISGYAELIATGMASKKEGRHFAEEIHQNAQRLLVLINDILQLSQLDDTPEQQFTFEPVDLYELAVRCMEMMEPVAARHGVQLSLKGALLFDSGSSQLRPESLPIMDKVGLILERYAEGTIEIEGHTDNVPMSGAKYSNNNELSSGRALSVFDYILSITNLNPANIKHAGRGEYLPVADNATPEGRAKNRRVEIKIYNSLSSY